MSYLTHGLQCPMITTPSALSNLLNEFTSSLSQVNILNLFFLNTTTIIQVLLTTYMYILFTRKFKLLLFGDRNTMYVVILMSLTH